MINKQPIFTAIPITKGFGGDLELNEGDTLGIVYDAVTPIYIDQSSYGTLIRRITVIANGLLERQINSKRIDLYISPGTDNKFNLYKSGFMTGLPSTTQQEDEIPTVVFDFPDGLIIPQRTVLGLTTTLNNATSGDRGDLVSVVVEGGTYDQPPSI
jgi:hypothetical protein